MHTSNYKCLLSGLLLCCRCKMYKLLIHFCNCPKKNLSSRDVIRNGKSKILNKYMNYIAYCVLYWHILCWSHDPTLGIWSTFVKSIYIPFSFLHLFLLSRIFSSFLFTIFFDIISSRWLMSACAHC